MNLESKIIEEASSELIKKFPELKGEKVHLSIQTQGNKLLSFQYKFPKNFDKSKKPQAVMTIVKKANQYGIPKTSDLDS